VQNWRDVVLAYYKEVLVDPYSVRDATIADPFWSAGIVDSGWAVCTRFNSKNRLGAYGGRETRAVLLVGARAVPVDPDQVCYAAPTYRPFPELEGHPPRPS